MSRTYDTRPDHVRKSSKAQAGIARDEHFANGGDLASWRGVHTVTRNKTKYTRRSKHVGRREW